MEPVARLVGIGKPLPIETFSGRLPTGMFKGSPFVDFQGVTAEGVDFSGRHFETFTTEGSTFEDCDFSNCRFESGHLGSTSQSTYRHCRFDRSSLQKLLPGPSRFENCSFEKMRLSNWWPTSAEFLGCTFSGQFSSLVLSGVPLFPYDTPGRLVPWRTRNEFRNNDFSRANLVFPDFRWGLVLAGNLWPSGPDYVYLDRWRERLANALHDVALWPQDRDREAALWFIRLKQRDGRERQEEMLFRPKDFERKAVPPTAMKRLLETLQAPLP